MQIRKKKRIREGMVEHLTIGNHIANCIIHFCLIMVAVISLLPMWHVLMSSVSDGFSLLSYKGVAVVPVGKPTLEGYRLIFRDASVWIGYKNTIIYVAGTVGLGFVLNVLGGYALSQPTKGKGIMYGFLFVTMLFSGGIVPTYMVMNTLGLTGSRLSIILLEATQTFYLIFAAKAFAAVPLSTVEAARIDGAGHLRVMFQIMLPQAKGMFFITLLNTFVGAWNSWYNASIYVPSDKTKWPIQLFINEMTSANVNFLETATPNYSRYLIQFAVIVVATLPSWWRCPSSRIRLKPVSCKAASRADRERTGKYEKRIQPQADHANDSRLLAAGRGGLYFLPGGPCRTVPAERAGDRVPGRCAP